MQNCRPPAWAWSRWSHHGQCTVHTSLKLQSDGVPGCTSDAWCILLQTRGPASKGDEPDLTASPGFIVYHAGHDVTRLPCLLSDRSCVMARPGTSPWSAAWDLTESARRFRTQLVVPGARLAIQCYLPCRLQYSLISLSCAVLIRRTLLLLYSAESLLSPGNTAQCRARAHSQTDLNTCQDTFHDEGQGFYAPAESEIQ